MQLAILVAGAVAYVSNFQSVSSIQNEARRKLHQPDPFNNPYNPTNSDAYRGNFQGNLSVNQREIGKKAPNHVYYKPENTYAANVYLNDQVQLPSMFSKKKQQEQIDRALNETDYFLRPEHKTGFQQPYSILWH